MNTYDPFNKLILIVLNLRHLIRIRQLSFLIIVLISIFNISNTYAQVTPEYTFINAATGCNSIPMGGGTWANQRNQWFYAPGDFGNVPEGMAITNIYVRGCNNSAQTTYTNFEVSMGQPNIMGLTTAWVTGLTQVRSPGTMVLGPSAADLWLLIELDEPFIFDPSLPLVIETIQTATSGGIALRAGGGSLNPSYTGNTQTYGPSTNPTGTNSRIYSYAMGIDVEPSGGCASMDSPAPAPQLGISAPDTAYVNSPLTVFSNTPVSNPQYDYWYIDDVLKDSAENKDIRSFKHTFTSTGIYDIKLVSKSCDYLIGDSIIHNIVIINPTSPPVADFISNKNYVESGENVKFYDLSRIGPSSWQWQVAPPTVDIFNMPFATFSFAEGTNAQTQDPMIRFPWPGTFSIQLTATNMIGSDIKEKENYIFVGFEMCPDIAPEFTTSSDPAGLLFDDGGKGEYGSNMSCNFLIEPCVEKLYITFEKFELECGKDFVRIYDGIDNKGIPLFTGDGFTGGGDNCGSLQLPPDTLIALSGRAYVEWESAQNNEKFKGFELRWFSDEKLNAPRPSFEVADTICADWPVYFENTSTGGGIENVYWNYDVTGSGTYSDMNWNGSYQYTSPGTYTVGLITEDCAGLRDTFLHQVYVELKTAPPIVDFSADNLTPQAIVDVVSFTSEVTGGCNDIYEWVFSPSHAVEYVNGTDSGSQHPQVRFVVSGCVGVALHITNPTGTIVEDKVCYIQVFAYCQPAVTYTNQDIGITKVVLEDINNSSPAGNNNGYTNYLDSAGIFTSLEAGQTYSIRIERNTTLNNVDRGAWIDFNQDRNFSNDELIAFESNSNAKNLIANFQVPGNAKPGATRLRVAVNYGGQGLRSCGPHQFGEFEDYLIYITPDITPPQITLLDNDTVYVEVFGSFNEPGYYAWDDADGDLTSEVSTNSNVDTDFIGIYYINYEVSDANGNIGTANRVVIVQDTELPEITLVGDDPLYVEVNTDFVDPGVTITDNYWNDIIPQINTDLDMTEPGVYEMEYCVTDGSGNGPVCVKRTIIVEDNTAPYIIFYEGDTVKVEVYSDFEAPVIIEDNYWAFEDLIIDATDAENFTTDELGYFSLTYEATDGSGNTSVAVLVVHVVDTEAPVIELLGEFIINVRQYQVFNDPGVKVNDNFDKNPEIITAGTFENTHEKGMYKRTYQAIDQSGNKSEILTRYISVNPAFSSIENGSEKLFDVNVYPNPSDGNFSIKIEMNAESEGHIIMTDMLGREIKTVVDGLIENKVYEVDMTDAASGVYLIRIETTEHIKIERINLSR